MNSKVEKLDLIHGLLYLWTALFDTGQSASSFCTLLISYYPMIFVHPLNQENF